MNSPLAIRKLYVHGAGATLRIAVAAKEDYDPRREARAILDLLEKFLPRATFEAILELLA
jgi:hypothetical protein